MAFLMMFKVIHLLQVFFVQLFSGYWLLRFQLVQCTTLVVAECLINCGISYYHVTLRL